MKKNILIFCHSYVDGFIEAVNQYAQIFPPDLYDVTIVYLIGKSNPAVLEKHLNTNIIFLDTPKSSTRGLKSSALKKMLQLQLEKKFQIVICHRYKPSYIMMLVANILTIPLLFFVMSDMKTFSSWRRKLVFALLAKKNMILAGVSNAVRDDIRRDVWRIPKERVITLYNMIDIPRIENKFFPKELARNKLNVTPNDFVFGVLARLAEAKDHETLIKGFALAKLKCPHAKLLIIGGGALENTLRTQIQEMKLENDIFLTGYLKEGLQLLSAFDVFVLTSIREAFGRVLLEAMLAKLPIIATDIDGIPEVVADHTLLIPVKDSNALAAKMIALYQLSPIELKKKGEEAYQHTLDHFSTKHFQDIFFNLSYMTQLNSP